jgi:hypothetical protein
MLHHDRNYLASVEHERLRRAAHHRPPADQRAWSMLSMRFAACVRRIARSHGLGSHNVDDAAQETMLANDAALAHALNRLGIPQGKHRANPGRCLGRLRGDLDASAFE